MHFANSKDGNSYASLGWEGGTSVSYSGQSWYSCFGSLLTEKDQWSWYLLKVEVSWNQGCWIGFRCPDCTLDPVSWTQECCFHLRQAYAVSLPDGEECLCVPSYWKELILQRLPFICINNGLYITWFPYRVPYNGLKEYSWLANAFNAAEKQKWLAGKSERASTSK